MLNRGTNSLAFRENTGYAKNGKYQYNSSCDMCTARKPHFEKWWSPIFILSILTKLVWLVSKTRLISPLKHASFGLEHHATIHPFCIWKWIVVGDPTVPFKRNCSCLKMCNISYKTFCTYFSIWDTIIIYEIYLSGHSLQHNLTYIGTICLQKTFFVICTQLHSHSKCLAKVALQAMSLSMKRHFSMCPYVS
jgi:hypothetical protein